MEDEKFEKLCEKYHKMIYSIINSLHIYNGANVLSNQDLYQEALIALYEAQKCYDIKYDSSFTTFAYIVIKRKLVKITQKHNKIAENESISYDGFEKFDYFDKLGYELENEFDYPKARNRFYKYLQKLETSDRKIIDLYLKRKSYQQIAETLKISTKKVDNRLQSIKRKLKKEYDLDLQSY